MLALGGSKYGSSYFEFAVPKEIYQVGMLDVITPGADGMVQVRPSSTLLTTILSPDLFIIFMILSLCPKVSNLVALTSPNSLD